MLPSYRNPDTVTGSSSRIGRGWSLSCGLCMFMCTCVYGV